MYEPMKTYSRITGLSEVRRLPRLGKIRLGVKAKSSKGTEYPKEVSYFVCPPEVQKVYGPEPIELDVMFPVDDSALVFPQALKWYTASSLRCKGDGQTAMRRAKDLTPEQKAELNGDVPEDLESLTEVKCPCPKLDAGECGAVGNLMILLPKVSMGGVYQIDTGSSNNIIRINSALDYVRALCGRIVLIPLKLRRVPEEITHEGKTRTHYLLSLEFNGNIQAVKELRENEKLILAQAERVSLPSPAITEEPQSVPQTQSAEPITDEDESQEKLTEQWQTRMKNAKDLNELAAIWNVYGKAGGPCSKLSPENQVKVQMAKDERKTKLNATGHVSKDDVDNLFGNSNEPVEARKV